MTASEARGEDRAYVSSPFFEVPVGLAETFHRDGFAIAQGVFAPHEIAALADHVFHLERPSQEELDRLGVDPWQWRGAPSLAALPPAQLVQSERLLRLHLLDPRARALLLDPRLFALVRALWPGEPLAVHMLFFPKPPGGRGMALHTDTGYLPVDPSEVVGCFVAADDADADNGALEVVRGSHRFTGHVRRVIPMRDSIFPEEFVQPPGSERVLVPLRAGDVLLFHGDALHGSNPNVTADRWRRAFVCHYVSAAVRSVSEHFHPALRSTGEVIPAPGHEGDAPVG